MEIGLIIRYGKLVPGREEQAIHVYGEAVRYFREKVERGVLTHFEPFLFQTSDLEEETGFFVIEGGVPEVFRLMEEEEYLVLMQKAMVLVEHLHVSLLTVGEGIDAQIDRAAKTIADLGLVR